MACPQAVHKPSFMSVVLTRKYGKTKAQYVQGFSRNCGEIGRKFQPTPKTILFGKARL